MKELKNAVIGVLTLAITTLGGVYINKLVNVVDEPDEVEVVSSPPPVSKKDTLVVIQQTPKEKQAKPVEEVKPVKKKKEFEW